MHTLPVATWQLVISKFLCALAVTVLNGVVAVAAVVVLMSVVAFFALDIGGTVVIDLADTLGIPLLVKGEHLALWSGTLLMCLTAAAMLAVTSLLLRQRLNLE